MNEIIPRREDCSQAALAFCEKCGSARIFEDAPKSLFADTGNWENCFACKQYRWFFRVDQHCRIVNKRQWQWKDGVPEPIGGVSPVWHPGDQVAKQRTADCYPTAEEINDLPAKFTQYIHDLETRCDKSGDVQTIALLREDREALQRRVEELESDLRKPREEFRAMVLKDIENRLLEQQQDDARRAIERIRFWIQG